MSVRRGVGSEPSIKFVAEQEQFPISWFLVKGIHDLCVKVSMISASLNLCASHCIEHNMMHNLADCGLKSSS